jgi:hypothetical protein
MWRQATSGRPASSYSPRTTLSRWPPQELFADLADLAADDKAGAELPVAVMPS